MIYKMSTQLGGKRGKKSSKKSSKKSKMQKGGVFSLDQLRQRSNLTSNMIEYQDPIFLEKIRYDQRCPGDEEYVRKREQFVQDMKDPSHPCAYKENQTQAELAACRRAVSQVIDRPCGNDKGFIKCMAVNAGQTIDNPCGGLYGKKYNDCIIENANKPYDPKGTVIRRFRGEPIRIANRNLIETDQTQNYDNAGTTLVKKYCSGSNISGFKYDAAGNYIGDVQAGGRRRPAKKSSKKSSKKGSKKAQRGGAKKSSKKSSKKGSKKTKKY